MIVGDRVYMSVAPADLLGSTIRLVGIATEPGILIIQPGQMTPIVFSFLAGMDLLQTQELIFVITRNITNTASGGIPLDTTTDQGGIIAVKVVVPSIHLKPIGSFDLVYVT
jgi:hypothetical protein